MNCTRSRQWNLLKGKGGGQEKQTIVQNLVQFTYFPFFIIRWVIEFFPAHYALGCLLSTDDFMPVTKARLFNNTNVFSHSYLYFMQFVIDTRHSTPPNLYLYPHVVRIRFCICIFHICILFSHTIPSDDADEC